MSLDTTTETTTETTTDTSTTTDTQVVDQSVETSTADTATTEISTDTSTTDDTPAPFYEGLGEDWRAQVVASMRLNDPEAIERETKRLERFKDYGTYAKSTYDTHQKLSRGEVSTGLPENPTDEQLAAYREANGIPETHEKYELDFGEGVTLSEKDQAIIDTLTPVAHAANMPNAAMSELGKAFFEARVAQADKERAQDELDKQSTTQLLRDEWGPNYPANVNIMNAFIDGLPEDARSEFANMRGPGGKALANNPAIINAVVDLMRKANPTVTVVPAGDGNPIKTIEDELASLNKMMREEPDKWYKDDKAQARWRELTEVQERLATQN